jgi:hypothetical protein
MDGNSVGEVAKPGGPVAIVRFKCPRHCPWFRDYTKSDKWMGQLIDHPLYGPIVASSLVRLEIQSHSCIETRNARIRHHARKVANHG